jgi:hypothetical protein
MNKDKDKNSNEKKKLKLGEPYGTARNKLIKQLLFKFVKELKLNTCYHCNREILDIRQLSIEHKKPWLNSENPAGLFYDLENIAFSHLSCNCAASEQTEENKNKFKDFAKNLLKESNPSFKGTIKGINLKTQEVFYFNGLQELEKFGFIGQHVYACCLGKRKTHQGFKFERI